MIHRVCKRLDGAPGHAREQVSRKRRLAGCLEGKPCESGADVGLVFPEPFPHEVAQVGALQESVMMSPRSGFSARTFWRPAYSSWLPINSESTCWRFRDSICVFGSFRETGERRHARRKKNAGGPAGIQEGAGWDISPAGCRILLRTHHPCCPRSGLWRRWRQR